MSEALNDRESGAEPEAVRSDCGEARAGVLTDASDRSARAPYHFPRAVTAFARSQEVRRGKDGMVAR